MSIRNLERAFRPASVAVVGASDRPGAIGNIVLRNLREAGFEGAIWPVNLGHREVGGLTAYATPEDLPGVPDLAVICTPPATVAPLLAALARRRTGAAVVITAGVEVAGDGRGRWDDLLAPTRPALMRVVGPNCLGVVVPPAGLNVSFAHVHPPSGHLAFVAQSGAVVTSVLDWAEPRGIGFSHLVSLGDMADVDLGDMLDYLANDRDTHAILLYMETVTQARKFMSAARAAARMKPVVVVKAGRFPEGARAAASHTGALAGVDAVYDAAFRRAGVLRVLRLEELFNAVEVLARCRPPVGDRLAVITNGGGLGVLAVDALVEEGGRLAVLSSETIAALDGALPANWSGGNPVDIIGDADGQRYRDALRIVGNDPGVDALLAIHCPTARVSSLEAAVALAEPGQLAAASIPVPVLTSWVGDGSAREARQRIAQLGWPAFESPEDAVQAFMYLVRHARAQRSLMEAPPSIPESFTPDLVTARAIVTDALRRGSEWLGEADSKRLLEAFGIACVPTRVVADPEAAARAASEFFGPVALKIRSPDLTHKSDIGGVTLGLADGAAVLEAAEAMLERVARARPDATIEGFTVSPMVTKPRGYELIAGLKDDPQFGPVVLFGHGGTAVEYLDDTQIGLPPLNMRLAREMVLRTRVARLLQGFRDRPAVDLDAVCMALIRLAQIAIDLPEVAELDVNPLLADSGGVLALDARVRLMAPTRSGADRLCIRPYPKELESEVSLPDGRTLTLRPILPEDEAALQRGFRRLDAETVRRRFFVPLKALSHLQAARFTQLDYEREMALVLGEHGRPGDADLHGVVRLSADPDGSVAEFAIVLERDYTGMGLGELLMRRLIDYARSRGIRRLFGDVLRENAVMLGLCERLGFRREPCPGEPELIRVVLEVDDAAGAG